MDRIIYQEIDTKGKPGSFPPVLLGIRLKSTKANYFNAVFQISKKQYNDNGSPRLGTIHREGKVGSAKTLVLEEGIHLSDVSTRAFNLQGAGTLNFLTLEQPLARALVNGCSDELDIREIDSEDESAFHRAETMKPEEVEIDYSQLGQSDALAEMQAQLEEAQAAAASEREAREKAEELVALKTQENEEMNQLLDEVSKQAAGEANEVPETAKE